MKNRKLEQLFGQARQAVPPTPSTGFDAEVLRTIRNDPAAARTPEAVTIFDQLNALFPNLAWTAAVIIVLCVAADFGLGNSNSQDIDDLAAQSSDAWLFNSNGL